MRASVSGPLSRLAEVAGAVDKPAPFSVSASTPTLSLSALAASVNPVDREAVTAKLLQVSTGCKNNDNERKQTER
jgi:hypothetical protein